MTYASMVECQDKADEELVALTLKQPDYFLCIMRRYERRLLTYVRRIASCCPGDAEDIVQEAYIRAYSNIGDFSEPLKFSSWMYRIAHNQAVSHIRRHFRRPQQAGFDDGEVQLIVERLASDTDVARDVEQLLRSESIKKLVLSLDQKHQEILVLRYLEDMEYAEISDILRIPMGTVATRLSRAKAEVRRRIEQEEINL